MAIAPVGTSVEGAARTQLGYVDADVHHGLKDKSDLAPYIPRHYRERFEEYGIGAGGGYAANGGFRGYRVDAIPDGVPNAPGVGAPSVELTQEQLLDQCGIELALLTGGAALGASSLTDVDYGTAIGQAFNDFTVEHWLAADARFRLALNVNVQDPAAAAAEIQRLGGHSQIAAIVVPGGAQKAYGARVYRPIHEACVEHGLTFAIHFGAEGSGVNPPPTAAGYPSYYVEARQSRPSFYQAHLASFVFEGTLERYPELRVAMLEGGFAWVPSSLWRMDADWKGLRRQVPWVKRLPSEYVIEQVRFASQPADEPEPPEALASILDWMHAERTLMFASDYPHWDWDDPAQTFTGLEHDLRARIMGQNAREAFRFS